jgi:hypothetical protein
MQVKPAEISLARASYMTMTDYKKVGKDNPSKCPEGKGTKA